MAVLIGLMYIFFSARIHCEFFTNRIGFYIIIRKTQTTIYRLLPVPEEEARIFPGCAARDTQPGGK